MQRHIDHQLSNDFLTDDWISPKRKWVATMCSIRFDIFSCLAHFFPQDLILIISVFIPNSIAGIGVRMRLARAIARPIPIRILGN